MNQELLKKVEKLFESPDKWNSFLELIPYKDQLVPFWNLKLHKELAANIILPDAWEFDGGQWFLKEFGKQSLSIWLEKADFSLWANPTYYNTEEINRKLQEPEYRRILDALVKERGFNGSYLFTEVGKFEFDSHSDNNFDADHLAWYAGNDTKSFIEQIRMKLQPFFQKSSTDLLSQLNRMAKR